MIFIATHTNLYILCCYNIQWHTKHWFSCTCFISTLIQSKNKFFLHPAWEGGEGVENGLKGLSQFLHTLFCMFILNIIWNTMVSPWIQLCSTVMLEGRWVIYRVVYMWYVCRTRNSLEATPSTVQLTSTSREPHKTPCNSLPPVGNHIKHSLSC